MLHCYGSYYYDISKDSSVLGVKMSINDKFLIRGERLKLERKRLKLTQPEMAEIVGKAVGSVVRYEKQGDPLNQDQLVALYDAGFDVHFITFGTRATTLSSEEYALIDAFRSVKSEARAGFVGMANAYASQNKALS